MKTNKTNSKCEYWNDERVQFRGVALKFRLRECVAALGRDCSKQDWLHKTNGNQSQGRKINKYTTHEKRKP